MIFNVPCVYSNAGVLTDYYGNANYMLAYLKCGDFPDKLPWKHIVEESVQLIEEQTWTVGLEGSNVYTLLSKLIKLIIYIQLFNQICLWDLNW